MGLQFCKWPILDLVDSLILLFVFHDLSIKCTSWNYNYDGVNVRAEPKE